MRNLSSDLLALLNGNTQFRVADLLTIVLADGTAVRLTSADFDITAVSQLDNASHTFLSSGPTFTRSQVKLAVGLQTDPMKLTIYPTEGRDTLAGLPWPSAVDQGVLDEARVLLERAYVEAWTDFSAGTIINFKGRVGETDPQRNEIEIEVLSDLELLGNTQMPRNVYQPGCLHTLFDAGCALNKAAFTTSSAAASGSTASDVKATIAQPDEYYALGVITFTSGANAGRSRSIKSWTSGTPGTLSLMRPFPVAPVDGDTFTVTPGCDKIVASSQLATFGDATLGTCQVKFNNLPNARAFPYVPTPENAV